MADPLDPVFKALADPTRRKVLDLLRLRARTTGELCAEFPGLSRFAVMKHVGVLHGAGLVTVRREGRTAIPVLRSVLAAGRGRPAPGCSFWMARAKRSYAASDRSRSSRRGRPAHATHTMAKSVAATAGTSHSRISTGEC